MGAIVLAFVGVMIAQLHIDYSFNEAIITTNYYALVISVAIFALLSLFCYGRKFHLCRSDIAIVALAVFTTIHSRDGLQTKEVVMSLSYIALYFALRLANSRFTEFDKYTTTAILFFGIDQSITVLRQVYGFEMSKNHNFLVSGDFFNPGPCGIFLAGILVLALTIVKRDGRGSREYIIDYAQYYVAYATLILSFLAIVPTLSRAGWLGAVVGVVVLYHKELQRHFFLLCRRYTLNIKIVAFAVISFCLLSCVGVYLLKKDSANGRVFMWQNTISAAMNVPLFGVGVGNFTQYYADAQAEYFEDKNVLEGDNPNIWVVGVPAYPFNEILAILLSLGIIGLILALYILYQRIFKCKNNYGAIIITIFVASLFSYTFYVPLIVILFIYVLANGQENKGIERFNIVILVPLVLLFISQKNILKKINSEKEWREISMFYNMKDYETVAEDSGALLATLQNNSRFMFEYGHSLNKINSYEESNNILLQSAELSTDPMFWNVIGNNYLALGDYDKSIKAYLRAYYQCPNRLYPIFLLTKLYNIRRDNIMMEYYGNILINKDPKIPSVAVDDMKQEVQMLLRESR